MESADLPEMEALEGDALEDFEAAEVAMVVGFDDETGFSQASDGEREVAEPDPVAAPFVGRWWRLESQTNWEKGRIIQQWRKAVGDQLDAKKLDAVWAAQVGGVTSGHVARLRRVFERFGDSHKSYEGLYWSHFLAAIDWHDAPLWLEGAVRSHWTVTAMRDMRLRATGPASGTGDQDVSLQRIGAEATEPAQGGGRAKPFTEDDEPRRVAEAASDYEAPFEANVDDQEDGWSVPEANAVGVARPVAAAFAGLPELPNDLSEALEMFKLAVLRHKATGWQSVAMADVLRALDGLRMLCENPADARP
jgi:hypothetical protein